MSGIRRETTSAYDKLSSKVQALDTTSVCNKLSKEIQTLDTTSACNKLSVMRDDLDTKIDKALSNMSVNHGPVDAPVPQHTPPQLDPAHSMGYEDAKIWFMDRQNKSVCTQTVPERVKKAHARWLSLAVCHVVLLVTLTRACWNRRFASKNKVSGLRG